MGTHGAAATHGAAGTHGATGTHGAVPGGGAGPTPGPGAGNTVTARSAGGLVVTTPWLYCSSGVSISGGPCCGLAGTGRPRPAAARAVCGAAVADAAGTGRPRTAADGGAAVAPLAAGPAAAGRHATSSA